jgi:hypothetical protein
MNAPPRPVPHATPKTAAVNAGAGQAVAVNAGQIGGLQAATTPKAADGHAALLALLKVEAEARDATAVRDLLFLIANETRKLSRARQIFVLMPGLKGSLEVKAISSLPAVDRNAPLVIYIEHLVAAAINGKPGDQPVALDPGGLKGSGLEDTYPFKALVYVPLKHGTWPAAGGMVLAREDPWAEQDLVIARRLASTYAHAWRALKGSGAGRRFKVSRWHGLAALAGFAALFLVKVPLSALAPAEIIARDPFVVAGPIDGVIEHVAVEPNQAVKPGDLLVKIADTALRNKFEVAAREVQVAEARLKQSNQIAFTDPRGMHDIGIARAELALKLAERDFARDLLAKTEIKAERAGLAIYSDKRDLTGRPVAIGERILEIADPVAIEAKIELPVADAIALKAGSRVKIFLDSEPLKSWSAEVKRADYKAKVGENEIVSFRVIATLKDEPGRGLPRLGVRGTAQVSGDDVALGLYLFRRPIMAARQWLGH